MSINVAYLINQYPKVSHSFIRREIQGIEATGTPVRRFAVRSCKAELVDPADEQELQKTQFILSVGLLGLLLAGLQIAITRPVEFFQSLNLAIQIGRCSERGLILHFVYLAEACVLFKWLRKEGIQHLHSHFGTNATTVAMLCESLGGPPFSFTVHGPEEFDKPMAIALPEKIKRAKFVVAISSFGKSQLYRWCSLENWSKIHVVHCGVDQGFLNHPIVPISPNKQLVCVGRLSEQKGHLLLLEAAKQLAEEDSNFQITFVGDGELRETVESIITQYHLQTNIKITGWATGEEVQRHLLDARAMILPSFAEGLPVVIMEALALGRPVISTYIAGIPELVEPDVCGWLVPAGSVENLVEAMRQALKIDHLELALMGKTGRDRVIEHHNIKTETQKLAELFHAYSR